MTTLIYVAKLSNLVGAYEILRTQPPMQQSGST